MAVAQVWKSSKFTIERSQGKTPGTIVFRLSGPFTARDMYGALSPNELRNTFESEEGTPHALHILDLSEVPYIDSAGLGLIVSHYVRCQNRGDSAGFGRSESSCDSTARDDEGRWIPFEDCYGRGGGSG